MKRLIGQSDARLKKNKDKAELGTKKAEAEAASELIRSVYVLSSPNSFPLRLGVDNDLAT